MKAHVPGHILMLLSEHSSIVASRPIGVLWGLRPYNVSSLLLYSIVGKL